MESTLAYRATPLQNGYSPAELLFNRRLRTDLPTVRAQLQPKLVDKKALKKKKEEERSRQKKKYDRHHGVRPKVIKPKDRVWIKDLRTWGTVSDKANGPRSNWVDTSKGRYRRNSFHLVPQSERTVNVMANPRPNEEQTEETLNENLEEESESNKTEEVFHTIEQGIGDPPAELIQTPRSLPRKSRRVRKARKRLIEEM